MVILGSTGSIGKNSLLVAKRFDIKIEAISCAKNYELLNSQIQEFKPKFVCIKDKNLKNKINHDHIFCGDDGILQMLKECKSKTVINALVGFSGLMPSIEVQNLGKTLALANKESLVVGGKFLNTDKINAIDSEHFGLKFLLKNKTPVKSLVITASGGAFYKTPIKKLSDTTAQMALKHPNWDMGAKITIDSATMANKLFEVLEAYWLYKTDKIDAFIERTSTVHALVNFIDGSTTAHISKTDMKLAIAHAIMPNLKDEILKNVELCDLTKIEFKKISSKKYPVFSLKDDLLKNPDLGLIINAANEIGVKAFLSGKCGFLDIANTVFKSVEKFYKLKADKISDLQKIDRLVRSYAKKEILC